MGKAFASRWLLTLSMTVPLLGGCENIEARKIAKDAANAYQAGQYKQAAELYQKAIALAPNIASLQLNRGFAYLSLFTENPKSPEATQWGEQAAEGFERYRAMRPEDPRGRDYLLQTFVEARAYDKARAYFAPEVEKDPPSMEALNLLAQIAAKVGKFDDALDWNERRAKAAPKDPEPLQAIGALIWEHLHRSPEISGDQRLALADRGITTLQKAVDLKPESPEAYSFINLIYRERALGHSGDDAAKVEADKTADLQKADEFMKQGLARLNAGKGK